MLPHLEKIDKKDLTPDERLLIRELDDNHGIRAYRVITRVGIGISLLVFVISLFFTGFDIHAITSNPFSLVGIGSAVALLVLLNTALHPGTLKRHKCPGCSGMLSLHGHWECEGCGKFNREAAIDQGCERYHCKETFGWIECEHCHSRVKFGGGSGKWGLVRQGLWRGKTLEEMEMEREKDRAIGATIGLAVDLWADKDNVMDGISRGIGGLKKGREDVKAALRGEYHEQESTDKENPLDKDLK